ncbi:hypothetical protein ABBQ32_000438 [Trebouxia sp. C0010 RCD-2024]
MQVAHLLSSNNWDIFTGALLLSAAPDCSARVTVFNEEDQLQVQKGEGWVTRKGLWAFMGGGVYVVYACLFPDGHVYDVSELSICQGMLDSAAFRQLGADCCKVWLHFGNPEAANRRQRYQPPNESSGGRKKGKKTRRRR